MFRTLRTAAGAVLCAVACICTLAAAGLLPVDWLVPGTGLAMLFPIVPKSYAQLEAAAKPSVPGQPESIFDILYSTQTFVDNTTAQLDFFQAVQTEDLGNIGQQAQLGKGEYFEVFELCCDIFRANAIVAAADANGLWNDIWQILVAGRPTITYKSKQKEYGPWPLRAARPLGGVWGMGYGVFAAPNHVQLASVSPANHGLNINGGIIIPEIQGFRFRINWPAVVNTTLGDYQVAIGLVGIRHRQVS